MSNQINEAHVKMYAANVEALLQQRGSVLMQHTTKHSYSGKEAQIIQQIGSVEATEINDRHADTELTDTPHSSRWMRPRHYGVADMVDDEDLQKTLIDPKSPMASVQQYALGRQADKVIIEGLFGTNYTGEDGANAVSFANDGGTTVAVSSSGLTVAKLRAAKKALMANFVDLKNDPLICPITAAQHDDLLGQTQVVSGDFNKPIFNTDGMIDYFFGIKFVHCELLTTDVSGNREVPLYAKSGLHSGMWSGIRTKVRERSDKWDNMQIATKGSFGGARTEGKKIVKILCAE